MHVIDKLVFGEVDFPRIEMSTTPEFINTQGVEKNRCTDNSKLIIESNNGHDIFYVQGIMLVYDSGVYRAVPHAWCKIGEMHFDPTGEYSRKVDSRMSGLIAEYYPFNSILLNEIPNQKYKDGSWLTPWTEDSIPFFNYFRELYPIK